MGCDIHAHVEIKIGGTWHHYNKLGLQRNYELFQAMAEQRLPHLLRIPAAVRFVSYEPALESVDFGRWLPKGGEGCAGCFGRGWLPGVGSPCPWCRQPGIDWLIVGGESGPGARPFDLAWARSVVQQCRAAGVPVFVKQMGAKRIDCSKCGGRGEVAGTYHMGHTEWLTCSECGGQSRPFFDAKGGDMDEWPKDLQVREWPEVRGV